MPTIEFSDLVRPKKFANELERNVRMGVCVYAAAVTAAAAENLTYERFLE